ncbi:MAG TPA: response regulator [Methanoregula sp.]|nr:response regulator [Methanoregula sp.]
MAPSTSFLEMRHFSTETAGSADEAMAKIREKAYDIVVSDYQMPGKDGIDLLREIRKDFPALPFILFTGRSREEVVIQALNNGADFYVQKGGDQKAQFVELAHKIQRAVERRRTASAIEERNEVLGAILAASPFGIALVKNRTIQWVNESLAQMLEYDTAEMIGMSVRKLYKSEEEYQHTGEQIFSDLKDHGQSSISTRLVRKSGAPLDCRIQMATLNTKNPLFSRMVTITDITGRLAITRGLEHLSRMPHLELNPVVEVDKSGLITYFNEAAIDLLVKHGNGAGLDAFLPPDIAEILLRIPKSDAHTLYRTARVGSVSLILHITISRTYQIARISAFNTMDARRVDTFVSGAGTALAPGVGGKTGRNGSLY